MKAIKEIYAAIVRWYQLRELKRLAKGPTPPPYPLNWDDVADD